MTDDQIKTDTAIDPNDAGKTVTTVQTPEKEKDEKSKVLEVNASTETVEGDPSKTITTLSSPDKVKLTVRGPFFGSTEVNKGTVLKEALITLNADNESSYGNFKYRDGSDNPVGLTFEINETTVLQSLKKGE